MSIGPITEADLNAVVPFEDFVFAFTDEVEIEADLIRHVERFRPPFADVVIESYKRVLRRIDELVIKGAYESTRSKCGTDDALRREREQQQLANERAASSSTLAPAYRNFMNGLRSPDPTQKQRFRAFNSRMRELGIALNGDDAILDVLEPAAGKRGRPRLVPPWRNELAAMNRMRLLLACEDIGIPEAARRAASEEGLSHQDSRADRFDSLYRARVAIRK